MKKCIYNLWFHYDTLKLVWVVGLSSRAIIILELCILFMVTSKWDTVLGALQAMRHGPRQSLGEMRITELSLASLSELRPKDGPDFGLRHWASRGETLRGNSRSISHLDNKKRGNFSVREWEGETLKSEWDFVRQLSAVSGVVCFGWRGQGQVPANDQNKRRL